MTSAAGRRETQGRRSARTRERILGAATEVFARRGFHTTRVADIADQAGIAYGLVYHYFKNKDEILGALFRLRWGEYVTYIDTLADADLSFPDRIAKLVHYLVETYRQEPHLMTVMINEISRSYEFIDTHGLDPVMTAFDAVEKIVRRGIADGDVRADLDPQLATYAILGIAEMVLTGYVIGTLARDREGFARDEEQLVQIVLSGMTKEN